MHALSLDSFGALPRCRRSGRCGRSGERRRRRAGLWARASRLRISVAGFIFLLHVPGRTAAHGIHGRETDRRGEWQRPSCCSTARISARQPGKTHRGPDRSGLPRRSPSTRSVSANRQNRRTISTAFQQLAGNTHALLASLGMTPRDRHRPFDRRHARHALCADLSRTTWTAGAGQSDRARGLEGQGRPLAKRRCLVPDGAENNRRQHPRLSAHDLLRRDVGSDNTNAGCRCWPGFIAAPVTTSSPGTRALLDDMAYTQPVFYEFEKISAPVLLLIGDKDTTAVGKNLAPPAMRPTLGNYPVLAKEAASRFPHAQLVEFPELGHAPQIQAPDVFHKALLNNLHVR